MTSSARRQFQSSIIAIIAAACLLVSSTYAKSLGSAQRDLTVLTPRVMAQKRQTVTIVDGVDISHVVVKFTDRAEVRLRGGNLESLSGRSLSEANGILAPYRSSGLRRLFSEVDETSLDQRKSGLETRSRSQLADLNGYYRIDVKDRAAAENLINELNALPYVELAYFQPMPEPAGDISPPTPDYQPNQDYREAAPAGVDADYANTLPGGDGSGVKIIDVEGAWQTTHEDLDKAVGGLIYGAVIDDAGWRNHGTAVIGEMISGDNGYGVTGISPGADIGMASIGSSSAAEAIYAATANLQPGDVILIELHAPGPHYNFQSRPDQLGYVCMEYWQANFDAIRYAWANGIIVCEAAGNGAENYDDASLYAQLFDTTYRNSHAIIIGAGYYYASGINLQKYSYSNYGERVNLQGYGGGVYTTGYGGLFDGGGDENQYYTGSFSGTSSASPIVTATVACLQGYYKATYGVPLTADYAREVLVATGTSQTGDTSLHIGPRPNLAAAIPILHAPPSLYSNPLVLDTTLLEGETASFDVWLVNRAASTAIDFSIVDADSSVLKVPDNWLQASPLTGTVPVGDSVQINVTFDATVVPNRIDSYKGALEVSFGASGGSLDSMFLVPAYMTVACLDTSYIALSSDDIGGPAYGWISARDIGFKVNNTSYYNSQASNPVDDGSAGPFTIGFGFNFYGTSYNTFYVGVNGAISFTDPEVNVGGYYSSLDIPGAPFTTFVSPFWNDLIIDESVVPDAGVYIYKKIDTVVIEWYRLANFNQFGDTLTDFEIILTKDYNIRFQYKSVGTSGLENLALIGLQELQCRSLSYFDAGDIPAHVVSDAEAVSFDQNLGSWVQAGDVDGSGTFDIGDITYFVEYLFGGGPAPVPLESADVNCNGGVDITDLTALVDYQFNGGAAPCSYWAQ